MFWPCKNGNVHTSVGHGNRYWARVKGNWGTILSAGIRIFRTAHSNKIKIKFDYALRSAVCWFVLLPEILFYACLKTLKWAQPNWPGNVADLPHRSRRFFFSIRILYCLLTRFGVQHRILSAKWSWSVCESGPSIIGICMILCMCIICSLAPMLLNKLL